MTLFASYVYMYIYDLYYDNGQIFIVRPSVDTIHKTDKCYTILAKIKQHAAS